MSTFLQEKIALNFLLGKYIEKKIVEFTLSFKGWNFFQQQLNGSSQAKHMAIY